MYAFSLIISDKYLRKLRWRLLFIDYKHKICLENSRMYCMCIEID